MEPLRDEEYEKFNPPDWMWVSLSDGSRADEEMNEFALSYYEKENIIKINKDFDGFRQLVESFKSGTSDNYSFSYLFDVLIKAVEKDLRHYVSTRMWTKPPLSDRDYYYIDRSSNELIRKIFKPVPCDRELTEIIMKDLAETMNYLLTLFDDGPKDKII